MQQKCALCGRQVPALTRQHLIPRSRHRNRRILRRYSPQELAQLVIMVCRPCHSHIHASICEKLLAENYASLEALKSHERIRRFSDWIANKEPGYRPAYRSNRRK